MNYQTHQDLIVKEFTKQASSFGKEGYTLSNKEYLSWAVANIDLKKEYQLLDVAAGTGHLSRAVAPYVHEVWAVDTTPAMIEQGITEAGKAGITNINYVQGVAEELPFPDSNFDVVMSRLAFHHFADPVKPFSEMVRVRKDNGSIIIMDLLSPEDPVLGSVYNKMERLRDPSHTYALTSSAFAKLILDQGLKIEQKSIRDVEVALEPWLDLTSVSDPVRTNIINAVQEDIDGKSRTGLRPFIKNNQIYFLQTWCLICCR